MLGWRGKRKPTPENGRTDAQSNNIRPPFPKASRDGRFSKAAWGLNDSVHRFIMGSSLSDVIQNDDVLCKELENMIYGWRTLDELVIQLIFFLRGLGPSNMCRDVTLNALRIMADQSFIELDESGLYETLTQLDHHLITESEALDLIPRFIRIL